MLLLIMEIQFQFFDNCKKKWNADFEYENVEFMITDVMDFIFFLRRDVNNIYTTVMI